MGYSAALLCNKERDEVGLWHFRCDQLLSLEQSINCGSCLGGKRLLA